MRINASARMLVLPAMLFALAFGGVWRISEWRRERQRGEADRLLAERIALQEPGEEIVVIYVGSSRCSWCARPELPRYVAQAVEAIRAERRASARVTLIGVAVETDPSAGLDHLRRVAPFDQVTAGGGWLNDGAYRYIWAGVGQPAATPQIIVLRRTIERDAQEDGSALYRVRDERILARKVGLRSIAEWVETGVPIASP